MPDKDVGGQFKIFESAESILTELRDGSISRDTAWRRWQAYYQRNGASLLEAQTRADGRLDEYDKEQEPKQGPALGQGPVVEPGPTYSATTVDDILRALDSGKLALQQAQQQLVDAYVALGASSADARTKANTILNTHALKKTIASVEPVAPAEPAVSKDTTKEVVGVGTVTDGGLSKDLPKFLTDIQDRRTKESLTGEGRATLYSEWLAANPQYAWATPSSQSLMRHRFAPFEAQYMLDRLTGAGGMETVPGTRGEEQQPINFRSYLSQQELGSPPRIDYGKRFGELGAAIPQKGEAYLDYQKRLADLPSGAERNRAEAVRAELEKKDEKLSEILIEQALMSQQHPLLAQHMPEILSRRFAAFRDKYGTAVPIFGEFARRGFEF